MPSENPWRGDVPARLDFKHEEGTRDDETRAADDLGQPVDPVLSRRREAV